MLMYRFVGVTHDDIRPDNILLYKGDVKLSGFKCSHYHSDGHGCTSHTGTLMYQAPELLDKQPHQLTTMWSLGVSLMVLLTGRFPFVTEGTPILPLKHHQDHTHCLDPEFA